MSAILANRALSTLAIPVDPDDLTITLAAGGGSLIPELAEGDFCPLTLASRQGYSETCYIHAVAGDVLTVTRGEEGSAPRAFLKDDAAFVSLTGQTLKTIIQANKTYPADGEPEVVFSNNSFGYLAISIGLNDTLLRLRLGDAARFPSITNSLSWFPIAVENSSGRYEIMRCTRCVRDVLTVERAQEGTERIKFNTGARVSLVLSVAALAALYSKADKDPENYYRDPNLVVGNYAVASLSTDLPDWQTLITLNKGMGARFPALEGKQWYPATLSNAQGDLEYCRVTNVTGDILTVKRAREGSRALDFKAGDIVDLRITQAMLMALRGWTREEEEQQQGNDNGTIPPPIVSLPHVTMADVKIGVTDAEI